MNLNQTALHIFKAASSKCSYLAETFLLSPIFSNLHCNSCPKASKQFLSHLEVNTNFMKVRASLCKSCACTYM